MRHIRRLARGLPARGLLPLAPLAILAGCGSAVEPEAVKATLADVATAQMQAIASDDLDGATRIYHDDAVMTLPDGETITGAPAIKAAIGEMLADKALALDMKPAMAWASEGGDLAVTSGTATYTRTAADGSVVTEPFAYQTVWRKADSGPWLIVSDVNYPLPPAATADPAVEVAAK